MHNRNIFSIFFNMKVCCVFSLQSPHGGHSYEHTQYTISTVIILHIGTLYVLGHLLFSKNNYLNDYINWDIFRFQKNFNKFVTV